MGNYRYKKADGWGHTSEIANNFKAIDFYKDFTVIENGNKILAESAVSMKTTTLKNVDDWLKTAEKNITDLHIGLDDGITWAGKTLQFNKAELHIYMKKGNLTPQLKQEWLSVLKAEYPKIDFYIDILEDFLN